MNEPTHRAADAPPRAAPDAPADAAGAPAEASLAALRRECRRRRRRERKLARSLEQTEARLTDLRSQLGDALGLGSTDADPASVVDAAGRVRDALVRRSFEAAALRAGARAPDALVERADLSTLSVDPASADVTGVDDAVARLRESAPELFDAPSLNGKGGPARQGRADSAFNPGRTDERAVSPTVRDEAARHGLPPAVWAEIQEKRAARRGSLRAVS